QEPTHHSLGSFEDVGGAMVPIDASDAKDGTRRVLGAKRQDLLIGGGGVPVPGMRSIRELDHDQHARVGAFEHLGRTTVHDEVTVVLGERLIDTLEVFHDGRAHLHVVQDRDSVSRHGFLFSDRAFAISLNIVERRCDYLSGSRYAERSTVGLLNGDDDAWPYGWALAQGMAAETPTQPDGPCPRRRGVTATPQLRRDRPFQPESRVAARAGGAPRCPVARTQRVLARSRVRAALFAHIARCSRDATSARRAPAHARWPRPLPGRGDRPAVERLVVQ